MKKIFSVLLISSFCFSPCVLAEDRLATPPPQVKLQKLTEEAARNKELLEIWKDHVRTLTKERDEAYQQIESLKTGMANNTAVAMKAPVAHFGEIETQPLPAAAMANAAKPISIPALVPSETELKGYQDTIQELRRQLDETRANNQKMQKEIMESGNDKTFIIKDKETAISKIEALTKQINSLKDENQKLTNQLRSTNVVVAPAASQSRPSPAEESLTFLQNSYNLQSVKLKQAVHEKERVIQNADELQKQYVDLQSAYEKLKTNQLQSSSVESLNKNIENLQFENNALRSKFNKLKEENQNLGNENQKLVSGQTSNDSFKAKYEALQKEMEVQSSDAKASQETMNRALGRLKNEVIDLQGENQQLKDAAEAQKSLQKNVEDIASEKAALIARNQEQRAETDSLRKSLQEVSSTQDSLKVENGKLREYTNTLSQNLDEIKNQNGMMVEENHRVKAGIKALLAENERLKADTTKASQSEIEKKYLQSINADMGYKMKRRAIALEQMMQKYEELKAQNQKLAQENQAIQPARLALQKENQSLLEEKQRAQNKMAELRSDLTAFKFAQDNSKKQIESLRMELQSTQTQKDRIQLLNLEKEKLQLENETMKKAMVDLEHEAQTHDDKLTQLATQMDQLRATNASLQTVQDEQLKTIENLKTSLKQSLDDIQNLKNNFQSYLESLVSSFEDRQKKSSAPA